MDCDDELVANPICHIKPVQVDVLKLRQSTVIVACSTDKACCGVQHALQSVGDKLRCTSECHGAVVYSGRDKRMDRCLHVLVVQ